MAEDQPDLRSKKQRYASQIAFDRARSKTRINIGIAFERWRNLRQAKRMKTDADLAVFLLDSYLGANPSEDKPELSSMERDSAPSKTIDGQAQVKMEEELHQSAMALSPKNEDNREGFSNGHPVVMGSSTGFVLQTGAVPSIHCAAAVKSENGTDQRKKDVACQSQQTQDNWTMTTGDLEGKENKGQNGVIDSCQSDTSMQVSTDCLAASTSVDDGKYMVDLESSSQHIVDEECILQLFKTCLECNRQCTVRKRVRGLRLMVYQTCYFCHCRSKWSSQPDADAGTDGKYATLGHHYRPRQVMSPSRHVS